MPSDHSLSVSRPAPVKERNSCLAALSVGAFALLRPHLIEMTLSEHAVLWEPDRQVSQTYFPISGLVSIQLVMADATCFEVGTIGREAAAGGLFDDGRLNSTTRGVVHIAGGFTKIPNAALLAAAEQNDEIRMLLRTCRIWRLIQAQQLAACNAVHSAEQRLCRWLVQCRQTLDTDTLLATQELIASVLGIRRTTITLIAQALQEQGLIHYRRGRITVGDLAQLRARACECCAKLGSKYWPSTRLTADALNRV